MNYLKFVSTFVRHFECRWKNPISVNILYSLEKAIYFSNLNITVCRMKPNHVILQSFSVQILVFESPKSLFSWSEGDFNQSLPEKTSYFTESILQVQKIWYATDNTNAGSPSIVWISTKRRFFIFVEYVGPYGLRTSRTPAPFSIIFLPPKPINKFILLQISHTPTFHEKLQMWL